MQCSGPLLRQLALLGKARCIYTFHSLEEDMSVLSPLKIGFVGLPNYCIHEHNSQVLCTCSTCYTSALNEGWAMFVVSTLMSKSQQVEGLGWGGVNGDPFIDSWKYTHYQSTDRKSLHHTGKSACVHVSSFTWELQLQCSD